MYLCLHPCHTHMYAHMRMQSIYTHTRTPQKLTQPASQAGKQTRNPIFFRYFLFLFRYFFCFLAFAMPRQPRRAGAQASSGQSSLPLSHDEEALAILLQRFPCRKILTMTDLNKALPRRLGFRSKQPAVQSLLDLAQRLQIGVQEGEANRPGQVLRLKLTVAAMPASTRHRLGLPLSTLPEVPDSAAPTSAGLPRPPSSSPPCLA